jgi:hypothetical protein
MIRRQSFQRERNKNNEDKREEEEEEGDTEECIDKIYVCLHKTLHMISSRSVFLRVLEETLQFSQLNNITN